MRRAFFLPIVASTAIVGCILSDQPVGYCTDDVRPAVSVYVIDGVSGDPVVDGVWGGISDGAFLDMMDAWHASLSGA